MQRSGNWEKWDNNVGRCSTIAFFLATNRIKYSGGSFLCVTLARK
jgi:hypothetical protein